MVSVGRPHAAVELAILDDDDRPVRTGDVGAVCLRSPAVMSGYWRDPDATRAAFTADGFVRTGDLGWVDDRGRLRLVGRAKEMYVRGGYNVYPVEVEGVLSTHPDVAAVSVVPRPDPVMGEIGVACVVPRDASRPPSLAALRELGGERLASVQAPRGAPSGRVAAPDRGREGRPPGPGGDARGGRTSRGTGRRPSLTPPSGKVRPRMQLEFTDDQEELRDGVRAMLARECPMSLVRAVVEDGASTDGLWKQMVDLGWPALTVPEDLRRSRARHGRARGRRRGARPVDGAGPLPPDGLAVRPGRPRAGRRRPARPVPRRRRRGHVHRHARDRRGARRSDVEGIGNAVATPAAGGFTLSGTKDAVVDGTTVDEVVVVARLAGTTDPDGVGAFVVPRRRPARHAHRRARRDARPRDPHLDGVHVAADRVLGEPGPAVAAGLRRAVEEATVALAIEMVGTGQTIFDVTLEYAKQREQFGVPIGSFQAIKHKFADMLVALERARATGYFAALTIAEDDERRALATASAKVAAGDCQKLLAKEGIQIHGGIGYTWEHDMHLYVRRVKSGAQLFGTAHDHRARIATLLGL